MPRVKLHSKVTREADSSKKGSRIGALFDLDKTLLTTFSASAFMQGRIKSGEMTPKEILATLAAFMNYMRGDREFSGMVATTTRALKGLPETSFDELGEEIFRKHLASSIYPEARALVKAHQARGHTVAIVSSATPYQIEPVARELGIEHVLCTRFEVKDGIFTGKVVRPTCWGEGKAIAARKLAKEQKLNLDDSFFYTDSHEDLPLLELVGKPRPLNPNRELATLAAERDWPVQRFSDGAKPDFKQVARNAAVFASLIPSAMVGLPVKLLSGSTREGANAAINTWVELACSAIGIDVRVRGREHVWSQRPAVFVYNHQCAADSMIVPKVLERDFVGVAKKEAADSFLYGSFMKAVGTVLIDRSDAAQARQDLEPAVKALHDGLSIVIAPEGTRSNSETLGAFKKGAFHIAMQAGVPIVPFVVHNAIDIAPPGSKIYRPATIEVEVLPPISTANWKLENMEEHVREVRNLFLERLGQEQEEAVAPKRTRARKAATKKPAAPKKVVKKKAPAKKTAVKKARPKKTTIRKTA